MSTCPKCQSPDATVNYGGERGESGPYLHCGECGYDQEEDVMETNDETTTPIREELSSILISHKLWLNGVPDGARADLSFADLSNVDLSDANLRDADLSCADLHGAILHDADLIGAELSGAELGGADLRCVDLSGADLSDADLRGAFLSHANLSDADISGAFLEGAELRSTCLIDGGQRSDGYRFIGHNRGGLRVYAGCRDFSMEEARFHWETTRGGTPLGEETMAILDHIERVAKIRGIG